MDETGSRRQRFAEAARAERPDLALLCLLVAAEADPALTDARIERALIEIDALAALLPRSAFDNPSDWANAVGELLGDQCDFRGASSDYQRLESSLLHHVLRRRRGLPILLSVVWIEVARRAGAPVYGVALPGHFIVGFGDPARPGGHVLADPFNGGRRLASDDAALLVAGATGAPMSAGILTPARPLQIMLRILNNIRAWAAARPERTDVQLWAVELALLLPSHPARLRYERAQLLVQRGDYVTGAAELEAYAEVAAVMDPRVGESIRYQARAARAMLN
ncbi:transglutaminase-like domain-containing protein [Streptomyces sp. H27-D2]|uniref:transglutaminase-like domain-containing protein n=1 Tax=Streptomyces sp. H27-D2 TaxID=3046304 RepID=UPI002DB6ED77|nr:transglutaminase-like domain-containing protein [Streptomyces sp. H27-D2]MEC4018454.1 transglutaminase-like domain-containing protein [Streptomyces sp. H27-D2]